MKKILTIVIIFLLSGTSIVSSVSVHYGKKQDAISSIRIDFFEEFPTMENLSKANLIDFNSTIYIAAKSLEEFRSFENMLYTINPALEAGYWPILNESYWISPFSYTYELENLIEDLQKNKQNKTLKVLLDLELPYLNMKLFFLNLFSFFKNKRLIEQIFEQADELNIEILTAESIISDNFLELLGLSYQINKYPHKKILMFYSSVILLDLIENRKKKIILEKSGECGLNLHVGLGCLARGIIDVEIPILTVEDLDKDLSFLDENGIKTAVIFRLGGLNQEYLGVIIKYTS
jgi:hypothetical protein